MNCINLWTKTVAKTWLSLNVADTEIVTLLSTNVILPIFGTESQIFESRRRYEPKEK